MPTSPAVALPVPSAFVPDRSVGADERSRASRLHSISRWRVKAGQIGVVMGLAYLLIMRVQPRDVFDGSTLSLLGLGLVLAGTLVRLTATGTLKKNEELATAGIYSICRHPLYLGSVLIAAGFGVLVWSAVAAVMVVAYFGVFYTVAILREDRFLSEKFGAAFEEFRKRTPAVLPLGRYRRGAFSWRQAMSVRAAVMFGSVGMLLGAVQVMHDVFA